MPADAMDGLALRGRRVGGVLAVVVALVGATACHDPTPPPRWAEGGAALSFAAARWIFDSGVVELSPRGQVVVDGEIVMALDPRGRVTDGDGEALAILLPDGAVIGRDDTDLGRIGLTNAAPPGSDTAWLTVDPSGLVTVYDAEGERFDGGRWTGCAGPVLRACTLTTHLYLLAARQRARVGVGGISYFTLVTLR